jgi:putative transposase
MAGHVSEVRLDTNTLGDFRPVMATSGMCHAPPEPATFPMCYGAEFTGQIVDLWAYHHKVRMKFSRRGTPTDNAHIESFNGSFRDECLNLNWFASMAETRTTIEGWRRDDNESRPHMALNGLSHTEFARMTGSSEEGSVQMTVGF